MRNDDAPLGISRWERWLYYGLGALLVVRGLFEPGITGSTLIGAGLALASIGRVINHITRDQPK